MSKQPMDLLPLIPGLDGSQSAARPLREAFQDTLDGKLYSKKVAEYIVHYQVDEELRIKENAEQVMQIYDCLNELMENIESAGQQIMKQQGTYFIKKDKLNEVEDIKERNRLQHCNLFQNLKAFYVDYFGFLQKSDLLPDAIKKFMDFRLNEQLHLCHVCFTDLNRPRKSSIAVDKHKLLRHCGPGKRISADIRKKDQVSIKRYDEVRPSIARNIPLESKTATQTPFTISPREIEFYNCEPGTAYKRTIKLINTSTLTQSLVVKDLPKFRYLSVNLDINSKLAAGLCCTATITYRPEIYRDFRDVVSFRNQKGFVKSLPIKVNRALPRLITCIFRSNSCHLNRPRPGSARFSELRREALNSTIDCGSCLVGDHVYISIFVQNNGMKGRFFIITEDEWYFENVETISTLMEYSSESLWIYPTFFELDTEETIEINILYFPSKPEMYLEKFYLMCDNNSYEQLEVIGDGLVFNKDLLKIDAPPSDVEINKKEDYCILLGNLRPTTSVPVTLTVHNTSSLLLTCYWKMLHKRIKDIKFIDESWVEMENLPKILAPYSTTDFQFKVNVNTSEDGLYSVYFNFFIADVPLMSLDKGEQFVLTEKKNKITKCADVLISELEIAFSVDNSVEQPSTGQSSSDSTNNPSDHNPPSRSPKVVFSTPVLEFGILPNGLSVSKYFWVENTSRESTKWKIMEVKYNIDAKPFMEVVKSEHISCTSGEFHCLCQKKKIIYNVTETGPRNWVSMLLLISVDEAATNFEIESLCIVTYIVINYDIVINGNSENPVLCPMKLLYTGVSHTMTFSVQNYSPITGMYCFLKPFGDGIKSVNIEISPKSGILKPMRSRLIDLKILSNEVGIFENIYIPCFIGQCQECLVVRLLCAVDTIHLAMYLPGKKSYYQKIMWPPKIVFEYDDNWMICPCTLEYSPKFELEEGNSFTDDSNLQSETGLNPGRNTPEPEEVTVVGKSSGSLKDSSASKSSGDSGANSLKNTLQKQFGDDFLLQDYAVEVRDVQLRTPIVVTFYMENVTPVKSSYTLDATNFSTSKTFDMLAFRLRIRKEEDIWNDMIMNEYGILVLPDVKEADLPGFGLIEVRLTIFANTWGIYQEEIAVDVADTPCFTFSLQIEVVGCPIMFPLARGAVKYPPAVRFGNIAFYADDIERKIKVDNTACIPLTVLWHSFLKTSSSTSTDMQFNTLLDISSEDVIPTGIKLDLTDKYFGSETNDLFAISPHETRLSDNCSQFVTITMTPTKIPPQSEKVYVKCSIIGRIFVDEHHRKKLNYFFRPTALEGLNEARIAILSALELPILKADFTSEDTMIRFYANDVIFKGDFKGRTRLHFQNRHTCTAMVKLSIDEPLEVLDAKGQRSGEDMFVVAPLSHLGIIIRCNLDYQKILNLSEVVYPKKDADETHLQELKALYDIQSVDTEHKILHIQKNLRVLQKSGNEQDIPVDLYIHFPCISAKPTVVKLDQVFLGNTVKTVVTVFNHTGCQIKFEIFKSLASEVLFVTPHYGEIDKSTGINKSFVNIFIYFTPREARQYQESIRIVTNIPNYFLEIPVKAAGSINEKFYKDYKI